MQQLIWIICAGAGIWSGVCLGQSYEGLKNRITLRQQDFALAWANADTDQQERLTDSAYRYLTAVLCDSIWPAWYGTPWNFNGITQTPRRGQIACGYFVTTTLRDAGLRLPRVVYAQMPSETMIRRLCSAVWRCRTGAPHAVQWMLTQPDGIYLVGLDYHTGFVRKTGNRLVLVHASYYHPAIGVMAESLTGTRNPFGDSRYHVISYLLHRELVQGWITGRVWK
ncbi:MAG: hypothetical protein SF053_05075 [Bacteroidia bacterium]|nr:hypothetical protein [Bacteroidia bacterium]